jgi:hypothetical protein
MELALVVAPAFVDALAVTMLIKVGGEARCLPLLGRKVFRVARRALGQRLELGEGQQLLHCSPLRFRVTSHNPDVSIHTAREYLPTEY